MEQGLKTALIPAVTALLAAGLLLDAAIVAEGVRRGLSICAGILIPALFPFMVLCCYLVRSDAARVLSLPLRPITTRLLHLPEEAGAVVLLALVGGYPVGAKMVAGLLEQGRIDRDTARRMLCFCVNPSPSFLISAVGAGMLMNAGAGAALYAGQILASLLVGAVCSRGTPLPKAGRRKETRGGNAFVPAVADASASMLGMCAYTVLFSGALALLENGGLIRSAARLLRLDGTVVQTAAAGLLEVTGGCLAAARLDGEAAILGISLCCSWGGLSVIFQVLSFFRGEARPGFGPFFLSRLAHGCLAAGITLPLYRRLWGETTVWTPSALPVPQADGRSLLISLCLLAMCSILVMQTRKERKNSGKRKR